MGLRFIMPYRDKITGKRDYKREYAAYKERRKANPEHDEHCRKANLVRSIKFYWKNREKICLKRKKYHDEYRIKNREILRIKNKIQYQKCDKEKRKAYEKKYRKKNKDQIAKQTKAYSLKHKEYFRAWSKEYRKNNTELLSKGHKRWYEKNKKKLYLYQKHYTKNNKEKVRRWQETYYEKYGREYQKNYQRERCRQDYNYRLKHRLRTRIWDALSGRIKRFSTRVLLDVPNLEFLWQHLEKQFQPGMTRENYGLWHVDHIIPCASFDFSDPEQQKKCFHYTNLQPLWAFDNISKGKSISGDLTSPKM